MNQSYTNVVWNSRLSFVFSLNNFSFIVFSYVTIKFKHLQQTLLWPIPNFVSTCTKKLLFLLPGFRHVTCELNIFWLF